MLLKWLRAVGKAINGKPPEKQSPWMQWRIKIERHKLSIVSYASLPKYRYQRRLYVRFGTLDVFYKQLNEMVELLANRKFSTAKVKHLQNLNLVISNLPLDDYLLTVDRVYLKNDMLDDILSKFIPLLKAVDALENDFDCKIFIQSGVLNPFLEEAEEVFKALL